MPTYLACRHQAYRTRSVKNGPGSTSRIFPITNLSVNFSDPNVKTPNFQSLIHHCMSGLEARVPLILVYSIRCMWQWGIRPPHRDKIPVHGAPSKCHWWMIFNSGFTLDRPGRRPDQGSVCTVFQVMKLHDHLSREAIWKSTALDWRVDSI